MRQGQHKTITVDGDRLDAVYLGRGKYSVAYQVGNDVIIYVRKEDYGKEILTHCAENPHIPICEKIDTQPGPSSGDWDIQVFRMPFYEALRPKTEAWAIMKELARAREAAYSEIIKEPHMVRYEGVTVNYQVSETANVPDSVREALQILTNTAANWGSGYMFDAFRKPNLGQDSEGRIILRDVLYDAEGVYNEHQARLRRHGRAWHLQGAF
jgi:hypothetical protein